MEYKRDFASILAHRVKEKLNFMQVVVGPRQVGKTTGVNQIYEHWPGGKVWADADLPLPPQGEWIVAHWNRARSLTGEVLLVFDEIQKIPRWSEVIKGLFDRDRSALRLRVVLLGSASLALSTGLNESLAGRFEKIYVPHWNLGECEEVFGWTVEEFLTFGGYPGPAQLVTDLSRWQRYLHDSIIEPVISRDIMGLASIRKPALFRQVFELALHYPAQEVSYQKLVGQLQELGNVSTVKHYLEILQEAFLIRLIPKFSGSVMRQKTSSPKIIPCAPALLHALTAPDQLSSNAEWRGHVMEAAVGAMLCERYSKVFFWSMRHAELDFVVQDQSKLYAIEVKSGRPRKNWGLMQFLRLHPEAIPVTIGPDELPQFLRHGELR